MSFNVLPNTDLPTRNFDSLDSDNSNIQELELDENQSKTVNVGLRFNSIKTSTANIKTFQINDKMRRYKQRREGSLEYADKDNHIQSQYIDR